MTRPDLPDQGRGSWWRDPPPAAPLPSIHDAARDGDCDSIIRILEGRPEEVNEPSGWERSTPLHCARDASVAELLIRRGAEIEARDYEGKTPLHRHCQYINLNVVAGLARAGADLRTPDDLGQTPMFLAGVNRNPWGIDIVRLLMGYGVPLDLNSAIRCGMVDEARNLLADDPDAVAAAPKPEWLLGNAVHMIQCLILERAGGHGLFGPDLEVASRVVADHIDLIDAMIARGTPTTDGLKALTTALELPDTAVADRLLAAGIRDDGSELEYAASRSARREEMVALLRRYGIVP